MALTNDNLADIIVNTSLIDIVADKIRSNILDGTYEPGQKLIVKDIESEMNVSQTPIKAALHRLVVEGYVEALPRRSMVVKQVTYEEYELNMELRLILEMSVVPEVIRHSKEVPELITGMEDDLAKMKKILESASGDKIDSRGWLEHDFSFHKRYVDVHPNVQLRAVYAGLRANVSGFFAFLNNMKHPLTISHLTLDYTEHVHILSAIKEHSADKLSNAIMQHITRPRIPEKGVSEVQKRIGRLNLGEGM
ncbi:MAG: GntR family transcriptional regulator [Defluviitaleaceae bacterium]|nr:GntR family transcriptional regulator [Defluviitaleaceae bacterium]